MAISVGDLVLRLGANVSDFNQGLGSAQARLTAFTSLSSGPVALGVAAVGAAMVGVGKAAIGVAADMEQARIGFATMLGSAERAGAFLKDLQQFAARTPFEFPDLLLASRRLMAMGFAAKDVIPIMTKVGDAVAAMGGGKETIDRVTLALSQMQAKGKVSAQEMNQLAEAGINAWQMLADKAGVSIAEIQKRAERGAVEGGAAVRTILEAMGERFAGAMQKQSETLLGRWSTVKDQMRVVLNSIGEMLMPLAKRIVEFVSSALSLFEKLSGGRLETFERLGPMIDDLRKAGSDWRREMSDIDAELDNLGMSFTEWAESVEKAHREIQTAGTLAKQFTIHIENGKLAIQGNIAAYEEWRKRSNNLSAGLLTVDESVKRLSKSTTQHALGLRETSDAFKLHADTAIVAQEIQNKYNLAVQRLGVEMVNAKIAVEQASDANSFLMRVIRNTNVAALQQEAVLADVVERLRELNLQVQLGVINVQIQRDVNTSLGEYLDKLEDGEKLQRKYDAAGRAIVKTQESWSAVMRRQVSMVMTDFSRSLTDIIFKGGKFKDVMVDAVENLGKALVRLAIEKQLLRIAEVLSSILKDVPLLGRALGAIFGAGSAGATAATTAAGAAGSAASAAGGAAGAASGAASGVMGIVGAVAGVATAVSSVIGNFQMAGMNKSLDLIERYTRFAEIHLEQILHLHNEYLPWIRSLADVLWGPHLKLLGDINDALRIDLPSRIGGAAGAGSGAITIQISGNTFHGAATASMVDDLMKMIAERLRTRGVTRLG